ncbi:MAG: glycosyltransferase family 2 protein [Gammaproteobacteria bacterium]|nr:glycosyltransferase family 2 protein [Gammaproteobacteria bacterium]
MITANIITLNEQENIKAVIESVKVVCDEIIVVDSQSTDNTVAIAKSLDAKVIVQAYLGDGAQKAFAVQYATNDWILSIDADERLDDDAIQAIKDLELQNTSFDAFSFARKTFIGKEFIRLWYPDRVTRLYNKNKCGFSTAGGHAKVETDNIKKLNAHLLHYSYKDYSEMIKTSHKFITRGARIAYESNKRASTLDPIIHGIGALFKALIVKRGIFHGINGWNVSVVSAFSSYMKYALILEMQKNDENKL